VGAADYQEVGEKSMKTIWKFKLEAQSCQMISMPQGAEILAVQEQRGVPHLWAICDSEAPQVERYFLMYGTGSSINIPYDKYIGTFQLMNGGLVFHVFETSKETALK
jgi:hypothetical protein